MAFDILSLEALFMVPRSAICLNNSKNETNIKQNLFPPKSSPLLRNPYPVSQRNGQRLHQIHGYSPNPLPGFPYNVHPSSTGFLHARRNVLGPY